MDYSSITFGLDVLVSVVFGTGGALMVWYKMKGKQDIQTIELNNLENNTVTEISEIKRRLYSREKEIKELHKTVEQNKTTTDAQHSELKQLLIEMKLDIIQSINNKT